MAQDWNAKKIIHWNADQWSGTIRQITLGGQAHVGWQIEAVNKTTGEVKRTAKTSYDEMMKFASGFSGFVVVKQGGDEADEQERRQLQEMLDADALPTGLRSRAAALGLKKTPAESKLKSGELRVFSDDENASFIFWASKNGRQQYFSKDAPQQLLINLEAIADWFIHHPGLLVTHASLDTAFAALLTMGSIQVNPTVHRAVGSSFGGRAHHYSAANDPTLAKPKGFSEDDLMAASRRLPPGIPISLEYVEKFLGDRALAEALCVYWTERKGR